MTRAPLAHELIPGIGRLSRSQSYAKRALYRKRKEPILSTRKSVPKTRVVPVGGEKNGGTRRLLIQKTPKYYPTEDVGKPLRVRKTPRTATLKSTLTPGTVVIILAGRFRGKRVVFLKQLPSGLLLVTGPYKLNGVPLRRMDQAYVIGTSTKVDLSSVNISDHFTDKYFKRPQTSREKKSEEAFFAENPLPSGKRITEQRVNDQRELDTQLMPVIRTVPALYSYLKASFSLSKKEFPHQIKF